MEILGTYPKEVKTKDSRNCYLYGWSQMLKDNIN